jgi:hypothetical protein
MNFVSHRLLMILKLQPLHKRSQSHKVPMMIITTFNQPGKYEMSEPSHKLAEF